MDQQAPASANGNGTKTIEEKIDRLAIAVKEGFDGVDKQFAQVDARFAQVDARFAQVDTQFGAIKADLRRMEAIMVTKSYLDEKLFILKGDLIEKLRKTNEKLDFVVALLRAHAVLSDDDLKRIRSEFQIFPSLSA